MRPGGGGGEGDLSLFLLVSQCLSLVGCSPLSAYSRCLLERCGELEEEPLFLSALLGSLEFTDFGLCEQVPGVLMNLDILTVGEEGDLS